MKDWLNIKDNVVVITGGSSGIGSAIVSSQLDEGAIVYNLDLNNSEVNKKLSFY